MLTIPDKLNKLLLNKTRLFAFNSATNLFAHFTAILVAVITLPMKLNYFGTDVFGIFILVTSLLSYFNRIDFGVGSTLQRYTANLMIRRKFDEIRKLLGFGALFNAAYGFSIAFILFALGTFSEKIFSLKLEDNTVFSQLLLLMAIRFVINSPLSIYNKFLAGAQYYFFINFIRLVEVVGDLIIILATIHFQLSILSYVFWISAISIVTHFISTFFAIKKFPFAKPTSFRWFEIKGYFTFSIQMLKSQISSVIQYEADRILIGIFLSIQWLTFYHVGERLHGIVRNVFNNLFISLTPLMAEKYAANDVFYLQRAIYDGSRIISFICYPVVLTLMFNAKNILRIWLGSEYVFLHLFASSFLIPYLITLPTVVMNHILIGTGKIKEYMDVRLLGAFFNLLISIILIHKYGIWGVLTGTICQSTLFGLYFYRIFFKYIDVDFREYFYSVIIPSLITIHVNTAICIILQYIYYPTNILELLISIILPIFFVYLFLTTFYNKDIAFIKRAIFSS